jgi:PAS domain S-box-containing protein
MISRITAPTPCLVHLDREGRIAGWNSGAERVFGYDAKEIVGRSFISLFATDDVGGAPLQRMLDEAADSAGAVDRPVRIVRRGGAERPAVASLSALRDAVEHTTGFVLLTDLAESAAEERGSLQRDDLEQILKFVLEQFPAGVIVHEPRTGRYLIRNAKIASIMRDATTAPARPLAWHLDGRQVTVDELAGMRGCRGETVRQELVLQRGDGTKCVVIDSGAPVRDRDGNIIAGVAVIIDITEQKQAEEEREKLLEQMRIAVRAREEVLAVVSHDLRNPLGSILLTAAQLERAKTEPNLDNVHRLAERIGRAAEWMDHIIRDLLDVSRIESGRLVLELGDHGAAALAREAVEMFSAVAAAKNARLHVSERLFEGTIRCDRDRILQVLSNLIGNAIRFVDRGGDIEVGGCGGEGEAIFFVRDDGPGIRAEDVPHLFERNWQARRTDAKVGLGLGLAIAKGIVEAHGGRIWAEPQDGRGVIFFFSVRGRSPLAAG